MCKKSDVLETKVNIWNFPYLGELVSSKWEKSVKHF